MTINFIIAQVFGAIALIILIISLQKNNKKTLLKYQIFSSLLYAIQYVVGSNNVMYMLTIESTSLEQLDSYEVKDIVDSFTISNFNSIEDTSLSDRLIVTTLSVIIIGAVYNFIMNRKNKKHVDMNSYNIKQ